MPSKWNDNRSFHLPRCGPSESARREKWSIGTLCGYKLNGDCVVIPGSPSSDELFVASGVMAQQAVEDAGTPTYLVSNELLEVCQEIMISDEDRGHVFEKLPYDGFLFCFEKDARILDARVKNVMVWSGQGLSAPRLVAVRSDDPEPKNPTFYFLDASLGFAYHREWCNKLKDVVVALLMLWRSRPEFVVEVNLPRADRYCFRGEQRPRTWKFPDKLIVRKYENLGSARRVRAHWRAGCFRHYRHERYKRLDDGSVRIEFILPCIIHAEDLNPTEACLC